MHSEHESYSVWNPNALQATSLIFNPDGLSIAAGTVDGRILLWQIGEPEADLLLGDQNLNHPCECLPEETRMMAIDCDPSVISIYSVHTQHHLCDLSGHQGRVTTTAFAPPSSSRQDQLCSASEDRTVRLWDITTAS
ncbi:WD40-repeat-containing domain protein, partial [Coprinopsis sp. MPI-PUGE-AT-0042]